jgi:prepilin-type N-terminal cleavage/methylation domain-containing protein
MAEISVSSVDIALRASGLRRRTQVITGTLPPLVNRDRLAIRVRLTDQRGFSLIEALIAVAVMLIVVGATLTALDVMNRTQNRDQAYAAELISSQTAFARLIHDLRQATMFLAPVQPNSIEFQMAENGTTYNVAYTCTATDTLGSPYTRCAESQALAPAMPGAPGGTAGSLDIVHVANGNTSTFCNAAGTGPSGAVFFPSNASIANTDGSGLACDEAYEHLIAALGNPGSGSGTVYNGTTYMQVQATVPASGDLSHGGLSHTTVLSSGVFLPNLDAGN